MIGNDKNDSMEALSALFAVLDSILESKGTSNTHPWTSGAFQKNQISTKSRTQKPPTELEAARATKEFFEAFIQVGFTAEQAFELLKIILSNK